jgi:NADH-quinone oxidoreductase subunit L
MEAPVPASALIHSATLVSAGLYLLLRFNNIFELSNITIFIVAILSAITSFYGGLIAMFQSDTKRILAYSTISHCGFLIVSFYFFSNEVTIFYLYVHGFFKAGVFLCVGNIIRFNNNIQDFKRMGGLFKYLPNECYLISVGLFNLGGLPLSIGFYMKHNLLVVLQQNTLFNSIILTLCFFGALTGIFYSYKIIDYVFFDFKKAKKYIYSRYNRLKLNEQPTYFLINSVQS